MNVQGHNARRKRLVIGMLEYFCTQPEWGEKHRGVLEAISMEDEAAERLVDYYAELFIKILTKETQ